MNRRTLAWLILLAVPASLAVALWNGSVDIPAARLLAALSGGGDGIDREIVWGLRAPRALAAFACGALLALAGTLLQALLRNPLADPFLLGVSGGAAAGALARRAAGGRAGLMALHEPAMAARVCDRAVLLYDSGRVRQGRIAEMLTQDNLELLYQCSLEPAGGPEARIFVPR